jgi:four helix bundle protein
MTVTGKKPYDLKERTREFALRIIRLYSSLPKDTVSQIIGKQLLRSGTSIGANYREATRSRSRSELISKMEVSIQELSEAEYWMELIVEASLVRANRLRDIRQEATELNAILSSGVRTLKAKS